MKIKFHWAKNLDLGVNDKLEANMEDLLTSGHGPKQCHPGTIHVFCDKTDGLCHTIIGRIECERGHVFFSFVSSPDGVTVNPKPISAS